MTDTNISRGCCHVAECLEYFDREVNGDGTTAQAHVLANLLDEVGRSAAAEKVALCVQAIETVARLARVTAADLRLEALSTASLSS